MKLIGLTGGIASGKTTVADFFKELGVPVINTDEISRQLTASDSPIIEKIVKAFGPQILLDGNIDKLQLKKIVFADSKKRKLLENILHPGIKDEMFTQISQLNAPYVIVEVPLLIEAGWDKHMDQVLLTTAPKSVRIKRLIKRDKISLELAKKIISSQKKDKHKKKFADDVVNTDQSLKKLKSIISSLHRKYLLL